MSSKIKSLPNEKISSFGERLKEAFENEANVVIASKLGVSKANVTFYMQGKIPPAEKLIEVAKLTRCNLNWLLFEEGPKRNKNHVDRPQGIILQGTKGGIGTSVSTVLVASAFALKGYKVLIAGDELGTCLNVLSLNKPLSTLKPSDVPTKSVATDSYIKTKNNNLDLFIPRNWKIYDFPENEILPFDLDYSEINKRYDFVIFDTSIHANPFYYPYEQVFNFPLEPILRESKVLMVYDPLQSTLRGMDKAFDYLEKEHRIYPNAEVLGILLTGRLGSDKFEKEEYEFNLKELRMKYQNLILNTRIEFFPEIRNTVSGIQKHVFSNRTKVSSNFSELVDEILKKLY